MTHHGDAPGWTCVGYSVWPDPEGPLAMFLWTGPQGDHATMFVDGNWVRAQTGVVMEEPPPSAKLPVLSPGWPTEWKDDDDQGSIALPCGGDYLG